MPFTPFHLGAGAALKAVAGDRFSFMVFGGTQVLMDLEPGFMMLTGSAPLHGPTHTLGGAMVIGVTAALIGRPISELAFRIVGRKDVRISWAAAWSAAILGSFTHIGLDAIMHADMSPWLPFAEGNSLLGLISMSALLGGLGIWARTRRRGPILAQDSERTSPQTGENQ